MKRIKIYFEYFLYWLIFFALARLVFILYNHSFVLSFSEFSLSMLNGLRQDASITGYLFILPGIFFVLSPFWPKLLSFFLNIYTYILSAIFSLLIFTDAELYRNWGFRMDATPLLYLKNPKEAMASTDFGTTILIISFSIVFFFFFFFLYQKTIKKQLVQLQKSNYKISFIFLLFTGLLSLPIRGSLGISPMNIGMVYFSNKNEFANHAAINLIWNIGFSFSEQNNFKNIKYLPDYEANQLFKSLYPKEEDCPKILKTERPNIIVVILESFTAKIIEPLGGLKGLTPNLTKIAKDGILFDQFYASGDRTYKGILAVLSSYPALPSTAIVKYSEKVQKLPTLSRTLKQKGYNTQWICGFDINFANIKSYLLHCQFDNRIDINSFSKGDKEPKWGFHDGVVFNRLLQECKTSKEPFFKAYMTLSSHEPFDVPMKTVIKGKTEEKRFLNSAYYTDKCIGNFIDSLKNTDKWKNTLVLFVADHGSRLPGNTKYNIPLKFHIPMIWTGGALAVRDSVIHTLSGQTDIIATLLGQLNISHKAFRFSKNIFSAEAQNFSFYDFNNGFGYLQDSSILVMDNRSKKIILQKNHSVAVENKAKAYMQVLNDDFLAK